MKKYYKDYINNKPNYDKLIYVGILCLIIVISGIFGFIYEYIFYYFNSGMKEFYYRGGNFLPWINIYAIGSLMIYFITFRFRKSPLKIFIMSILITGILELVSGYVMYNFFNFRCWDYNTEILNFGNIGGYVCLRSVLFFGISSLLLIYVIVPLVFSIANKMNKKLFLIISIGLCSIFLIDELYNLVIARIFSLPRASDVYKSIGIKYMNF